MGKSGWLLACAALLWLTGISAPSHAAERIRGAVTRFSGHELQVRTRGGADLKINVPDGARINTLAALGVGDIRSGSFVGVTAIPSGRGNTLMALDVHVFPEAQRGTGEGHYEWDLEPGSTMTNATVEATVDTRDGRELTLSYRGGRQRIVVPPKAPIVTFAPGDRSLLRAGARVFIVAEPAADGSLTAQRIHVGRDGIGPPM